MKTKNVVLTMVAVMIASAFTFATTPASKVAVINQNQSGVYKLIYEGATAGKVTLKIYDNSSNVIFSETKKGLSKFILPLNFTGLEEGEYSIEIADETGTQIRKVNYTTADAAVAAQDPLLGTRDHRSAAWPLGSSRSRPRTPSSAAT